MVFHEVICQIAISLYMYGQSLRKTMTPSSKTALLYRGSSVFARCRFLEGVAVQVLDELAILQHLWTQIGIFEIERSALFARARRDQFLHRQAEVDGPLEGVLVGVRCVGHQYFVLLINAGGKARLKTQNTRDAVTQTFTIQV